MSDNVPPLPEVDPSPPTPSDLAGYPPPTPATHDRRHETESSRTYPCDACGGELRFDIEHQLLRCAHCGNTHELAEATEGAVAERNLADALALVRRGKVEHTATFLADEKEVVCQNCGGHTTFTGSLTANNCPYCATPIQRDDVHDAPERLPVDGVLPFAVPEPQARDLIDTWINGRWFAPNEFKTYNRTGSFSSVYVAYFTYDADTFTTYSGRRGDNYTETVGHGDDRRTVTRTDWTRVNGSVDNSFDDVPIFANVGFDTSRVAKLEPWPTGNAKPYSAEYVAGHLCRTYDHDVEHCMGEATERMEEGIRTTVKRDIGGDQQKISSMHTTWQRMTYKHLLLPIWLLTVVYGGKPFQVYINGITGEVQGARPYSKPKIIAAVVAALVVVAIVAVLVSLNSGE
jgi:DNA-directed RNA polymerase subunit RPC12/RpoP